MITFRLVLRSLRTVLESRTLGRRASVRYRPSGEAMEPRALQSGLRLGPAPAVALRPVGADHGAAVSPAPSLHVSYFPNHAVAIESAAGGIAAVPVPGASAGATISAPSVTSMNPADVTDADQTDDQNDTQDQSNDGNDDDDGGDDDNDDPSGS